MQNEETPGKRTNIGELAEKYKVSRGTMRRWLKKIPDLGERLGHWYNSVQVKKIENHLGTPFLTFFAFLFKDSRAPEKGTTVYRYRHPDPESYTDFPHDSNSDDQQDDHHPTDYFRDHF